MQSLAFFWFELQLTKQYLSEKTFSAAQVPAKATNLHLPLRLGTALHPCEADTGRRMRSESQIDAVRSTDLMMYINPADWRGLGNGT